MAEDAVAKVVVVTEALRKKAVRYAAETEHVVKWYSLKTKIEDLDTTLTKIRGTLESFSMQDEHSYQPEVLWEKIKDVVYDAEDFFDECQTLEEKKLSTEGGKFSKKVRHYFSSNNPLIAAYKMSTEVTKITKKLDDIAKELFGSKFEYQPISNKIEGKKRMRRRREETCSYVYNDSIIGRENDVNSVVGKLLDSKAFENDVGCLAIVGMGGLGKTALAQLVYNDDRVCSAFPFRIWVSVGEEFDVTRILKVILISITGSKSDEFNLEMLHSRFQEDVANKKYLVVLDDIWKVNDTEWQNLQDYLMLGAPGTMIVVTTRSPEVAGVGGKNLYQLQPLSMESSWELFKKCAFYTDSVDDNDLINIGQNIVKSCSGIPLAIRVAASLLYGQGKSKWESLSIIGGNNFRVVQDNTMAILKLSYDDLEVQDNTMAILKLSYDDLESPLKICFNYFALFPKDHVINKEMLIHLWMAQGYIETFVEGQSIEDAGEDYYSQLLSRSFFEDIERDEYGEVVSCKLHSLMHDLAQNVAGKEICATGAIIGNMQHGTRHLLHAGAEFAKSFFAETKIRSYVQTNRVCSFPIAAAIENWIRLRVLYLQGSAINNLPESIGNLLHLRYIDLSENTNLKALPKSVTKLLNLQTLNIDRCNELKELPDDLSKLVKLRHLYVDRDGLSYMPPGMDRMTSLCILTSFVVADTNSSGKQHVGQLKELKALTNLRGRISITIPETFADVDDDDRERGVLHDMERLKAVRIHFQGSHFVDNDGKFVNHEALLESLQPHSNLKGLTLCGYQGATMALWGSRNNLATALPNLVRIEIRSCQGFQHLPSLSELENLKSLELHNLRNLEYMENTGSSSSCAPASKAGSGIAETIFFPSLKQMEFFNLPKLKGWWKGMDSVDDNSVDRSNNGQPSFPCLSKLTVQSCHDLTSLPSCPNLETLSLRGFNEDLQIIVGEDHEESSSASSSYPSVVQCRNSNVKLKEVEIDNAGYLKSLPTGSSAGMQIDWDKELESLPEAGEITYLM